MADARISAQEQLLVELVNRARLDPVGEAARHGVGLNEGLAPGTIRAAPAPPLAPDADLSEAAAAHSGWMLDADVFSHTGAGGSGAGTRMEDAGYRFTGAWAWGENISVRGAGDADATIRAHHAALFLSPGHRENILGDFREVGVGVEVGSYGGTASMLTEAFARTGTQAFITGVAYRDGDDDGFYGLGEGEGGVEVDWLGNGAGAASTGAAGGYALAIPLGLGGTATVEVTVGGRTMQASLAMTGTNVKLDVVDGRTLAASTDMTLGRGAPDGRLLGAASLDLAGNAAGNRLDGNAGANRLAGAGGDDAINGGRGADAIDGGRGDDRIAGGLGNDVLEGGDGADTFLFADAAGSTTGHDRIADLEAGDRIVLDLRGTLPREAAWEDRNIDAIAGGWRVALGDGATIDVLDVTRATLEGALDIV